MNQRVISNVDNHLTATKIVEMMKFLAPSVSFGVEKSTAMSEHDRKRGVGEWQIYYEHESACSFAGTTQMDSCFNMAYQLVLADALAEAFPEHRLVQTWYLRKENRNALQKYSIG